MKRIMIIAISLLCLMLYSCNNANKNGDTLTEVIFTIHHETGYAINFMSNTWTNSLFFSDNEDNEVRLLSNVIVEGLDLKYRSGYEYKFKAKKTIMSNPPQDVSAVKYSIIKPISITKVVIDDDVQDVELMISAQLVNFQPQYMDEHYEFCDTLMVYDAMLVKESSSDYWMALNDIRSFEYIEGYEYVLKAKKIISTNPYNVTYTLEEIISKDKIID